MNMPGKNIIHVPFIQAFIDHPAYRHMTHKDLQSVRVLKSGQKLCFVRSGFTLILRRQTVPVNTADPKLLPRNLHILILTIQNLRTCFTIKLMKISPIVLLIFYLMIPVRAIHRSNLYQIFYEIHRNFRVLLLRIHQIPCDQDHIRGLLLHLPDQPGIPSAKTAVMQIRQLYDVKRRRNLPCGSSNVCHRQRIFRSQQAGC